YYIDWRGLQFQARAFSSCVTYYRNGSGAKREGAGRSAPARGTDRLTPCGWLTYDDAVLTDALPTPGPLYGLAGARLPFSSRYSGHISVNYDFPLTDQATAFLG